MRAKTAVWPFDSCTCAFVKRVNHPPCIVTQGCNRYTKVLVLAWGCTDREGVRFGQARVRKTDKSKLSCSILETQPFRSQCYGNCPPFAMEIRDAEPAERSEHARRGGIGKRHGADPADHQHVDAQRIEVCIGFQDEKIVQSPHDKKGSDQSVGPFPEMIGDECGDRDHHEDEQTVKADLTQCFRKLCHKGFRAQSTNFRIDSIMQQHRRHRTNTQPFVQPIGLIQRAENHFDATPTGRDHLPEGDCDQRSKAKVLA